MHAKVLQKLEIYIESNHIISTYTHIHNMNVQCNAVYIFASLDLLFLLSIYFPREYGPFLGRALHGGSHGHPDAAVTTSLRSCGAGGANSVCFTNLEDWNFR